MPYFLYRISPDHRHTLIETYEKFQDARTQARSLRATLPDGSSETIRMIFAENPKKAQLLLTDPRNPRTDGDD